jgi:hypothetical protein
VPKNWPENERDIVILYIEDNDEVREPLLAYIQATWSPQSRGVRSKARARDLLGGKRIDPHVVIHDCQPLPSEDAEVDSRKAGDELYKYLVIERYRVVVMSGLDQAVMDEEPYRSDPPLAFIQKPANQAKLHRAVEEARRRSP